MPLVSSRTSGNPVIDEKHAITGNYAAAAASLYEDVLVGCEYDARKYSRSQCGRHGYDEDG
jgi:hypothetical protein